MGHFQKDRQEVYTPSPDSARGLGDFTKLSPTVLFDQFGKLLSRERMVFLEERGNRF
jgi:hypothetical protein